jgi:hypothetical protein
LDFLLFLRQQLLPHPQLHQRKQRKLLLPLMMLPLLRKRCLSTGVRQQRQRVEVVRRQLRQRKKQKTLKQPVLKGWNYRRVIREEEMS